VVAGGEAELWYARNDIVIVAAVEALRGRRRAFVVQSNADACRKGGAKKVTREKSGETTTPTPLIVR
jgi:hypothetical protein